jgi:hypothetical protein
MHQFRMHGRGRVFVAQFFRAEEARAEGLRYASFRWSQHPK